jgi:hypothetical protein
MMQNTQPPTIEKTIKPYSFFSVACASFIGGLATGFYLMQHNYRAFGQPERARQIWWLMVLVGVPISVGLIIVSVSLQYIDYYLMMVGQAFITAFLMYWLQKGHLDNVRTRGDQYESFFKSLVISLGIILFMSVVSTTLLLSAFLVLTPANENTLPSPSPVSDTTTDTKNGEVESFNDVAVPRQGWKTYKSQYTGISFSYPESYGEVRENYNFGMPSDWESYDTPLPVECRAGGNAVDTLTCTGAILEFVSKNEPEQRRPFLFVHGTSMTLPPQGGYWGLLPLEIKEVWQDNSVLLGVPNTLELTGEGMEGDMSVQFIASYRPEVAHVVVTSPLQFVNVTPESAPTDQVLEYLDVLRSITVE